MTRAFTSRFRGIARRARVIALGTLLLGAAACKETFNDIIAVDPFDRVPEEALFGNPAQAGLLVSSVQAQFECAYSTYVVATGLLGGEINSVGNTTFFHLDRRDPDPAGGFNGLYGTSDCSSAAGMGAYVPMASARWFADKVVTALSGWSDADVAGRQGLIATASAYSGFAHLLLGEGFCSMAIDGGPELTPAQVFALAEAKFTQAITAATAAGGAVGTDIGSFARVGRARARLDQNKGADALADAQTVPAAYVKNATRALGNVLRENAAFVHLTRSVSASLAPEYFDVRFNGKADPRVPATNLGTTTTGVARYATSKFTSEGSPIVIASGAEAALIAAEVQGGQAAVGLINALHTSYGLDPFSSSDPAAIRDQIIEERRRQFFLEGHRSYDRIRYNIGLTPAPGSPYRWGGSHGSAKCLPLPDIEKRNNTNF